MRLEQLLSLAFRESRFARKRLFLFLSAISLGVAALVAVQGFASNMQHEVRAQARAMLGADLQLASRGPFGPLSEEVLESVATDGVQIARVTSFASMARHPESGATRLVQVRAAEPGFPFYGTIETEPPGQWATLHDDRNVVVDPALLVALGAEIGDSIAIGAARFRVTGELQRLPGDIEVASSFAPRVFMPAAYVDETELLGFGARVEYEAFLRTPDAVVAESIDERYGLVGVFALLLGGIGVASAMSAYMARKVDSVAIFRCIGATSRQVFGIYLLQAAAMGLAGAVVGVLLGGAVQWTLPRMLAGLLPVDVQIRLDGAAVATGLLVGTWAAVAFALLPLLQVRSVSPLSALRRRVEPLHLPSRDPLRRVVWAAIVFSALLLVVYQAQGLIVGVLIAAGIGGTLLVLWLAAHAATRVLGRSPRRRLPYALRQGVANLHRPGNQTATVVLALGFGVFLIATLILTQANILRPLMVDTDTRFNMIFLDVQADQVESVEQILADRGLGVLQSVALVTMRIAAVKGQPVPRFTGTMAELEALPSAGPDEPPRRRNWALSREYRSTYRATLSDSEELVAGEWWGGGPEGESDVFEVSLETDIAAELGVGIGDRIDWNLQGVDVRTVVTSLRAVDWARLEPNFFAVFEPAALRQAPQMWVLLARGNDAAARAAVQRDVVASHSNVSAIDLTLVQQALDDVIGRVSLVIRFLAGFSVATGFIVLLGAVATGRLQRIRESVLLKTLGATRRQIGTILLTEYALLGMLAVVVGVGLSVLAAWGLARFLFEVPFAAEPLPLAALAVAMAVVSALVGLSGSREVFRSTPMEALREE
jgi:putative ABC transport system permease protein